MANSVVVIQTEFGEVRLFNPSMSLLRDWAIAIGMSDYEFIMGVNYGAA